MCFSFVLFFVIYLLRRPFITPFSHFFLQIYILLLNPPNFFAFIYFISSTFVVAGHFSPLIWRKEDFLFELFGL